MVAEIDRIQHLFDLSGRAAVVTGGSGALGRAVSFGLAVYGADVAMVDLHASEPGPAGPEMEKMSRRTVPIACDVTDPKSVDAMVTETLAAFGRIDILVTCAGINILSNAENMPIEDWERIINVNLKGTFLCCQRVGRVMMRQGGGKIVTVSSVRGAQGRREGYSAYSASKGGVDALTRQLACEWARYGIHVNALAPIIFRTPLTEKILSDEGTNELFRSRIPWGRIAEPQDFVGAVVFLVSHASDFMTGHILYVDGGGVIG